MIGFKTKLCYLAAALYLIPSGTQARQLNFEEAVANAPQGVVDIATRSHPNLLFTEKAGDLNVAYIVENGLGGYAVLSADDFLPALLGYSDTSTFDTSAIPPAMEMWLAEYGRQLTYAVENGLEGAPDAILTRADRKAIAPLCEAKWNQSAPFNNNCPSINGKKAPTGCTATAMAQVMYAHKWPVTGKGTNTYLSGTTRQKLTFDFGATTFDWANMLPSYAGSFTPEQAAAVATLMEGCGNATLMSYGADASGAYPYNALYGMVEFMGYDKAGVYRERNYYPSAVWDELVYTELAAGRPVIYGGYNNSSGHTFVVDGYNGNGFYHLNWGWGGMSDGYFLLSALDPMEQGIGGSAAGYNFDQDAVFNVKPAEEGSEYVIEVMWDGPFQTSSTSYTSIGYMEFNAGEDGYYKAFTLEKKKVVMGVNITPEEGGEAIFVEGSEVEFDSHYGNSQVMGYSQFYVPVSALPATGTFVARPAFKADDVVKEVAVKVGQPNSLILTRTRIGGVKVSAVEISRTLTATDVKVGNTLYSGKSCTVSAKISNNGEEYLGVVTAGFEDSEGSVLCTLSDITVNLTDGASTEVNFSGTLTSFGNPLAPGNYKLNIYDEDGNSICANPLDVTVVTAPSGRPSYDIDFKIVGNDTGDGTNFSPYIIGDNIDMEVTVNVSSGLFEDRVALYGFYDANTYADFTSSTSYIKNFFVGPGQKQTQTYSLGTSDFNLNETAYIRAYGWNSDLSAASMGWIGRYIYVKRVATGIDDITAENSGIYPNPAVTSTTVAAKSGITAIEVYSIAGSEMMRMNFDGESSNAEINVSNLQSGHYIVVVRTVSGVERFRLIKK